MEANYSEAVFVLKVKNNCQACKARMRIALGSICGVYEIDYSAKEGVATVSAVVDPNLLMKALSGSGPHAECIGFKLRHPKMNPSYSYNGDNYGLYPYRNGHTFGSITEPLLSRPTLPHHVGPSSYPPYHGSYHPYHGSYHHSSISPYYPQPNPYYPGSDLPGRYVQSYASEYDPYYADERYNFCSIM
ncbi:hypothetical protein ACS0TY_019634 [Phlomoides rotata]